MPSPMLQLGIYPVVLEPGRCALILFGFLCSWFSYLLVYSKPNPSVLRRTLIPNLNLLVRHSFSNSNDDEKKWRRRQLLRWQRWRRWWRQQRRWCRRQRWSWHRKRFDNDNDGTMMGNRKLASAAPPIRGNNQLMVIAGGGGDKRGGGLWRIGWQKRVEVVVIWWRHLSSTKSLPYLTSTNPRAAKGPEPILNSSWVYCCAVSAMISSWSGPNRRLDWQGSHQSFHVKGVFVTSTSSLTLP